MSETNLNYTTSDSLSFNTRNAAILGANGSGKSSLSKKLISVNSNIWFIGAQRDLTFQQGSLRGKKNDEIENTLLGYNIKGVGKLQFSNLAQHLGWNVDTNNAIQDDFSENIEKLHRDDNYTHSNSSRTHKEGSVFEKPITKADLVFNVRNNTFIDKIMHIDSQGNIMVRSLSDNDIYKIERLSDGERSALYLIIKCIHAPERSTILVDEGETHLNPSLLHELWNNIEEMRLDCGFVYISHDIDFITSRSDCTKFWIKNFTHPESWDIEKIEEQGLPEELILKIIGTKKDKILFVESTENKDSILYQRIYSDFKIVPLGSCEDVIKFTDSFNRFPQNYNKSYFGLIDRDFRNDANILSLKSKRVFCLSVGEFENIFFRREIISYVFEDNGRSDEFEDCFSLVSSAIFALKDDLTFKKDYYKNYIIQEFNHNLQSYTLSDSYIFEDDYSQANDLWSALYSETDYNSFLLLLNAKGIKGTVSNLGFANRKNYNDSIINIFNTDRGEKLKEIFLSFMPNIQ